MRSDIIPDNKKVPTNGRDRNFNYHFVTQQTLFRSIAAQEAELSIDKRL